MTDDVLSDGLPDNHSLSEEEPAYQNGIPLPLPDKLPVIPQYDVRLDEILEHQDELNEKLNRLQETVENSVKQVSFLPPQVRMLTGKIDQISTTIADSKYQTLLLRFLDIYDLVCGMQRSANQSLLDGGQENSDPNQNRSNLDILRTQLLQILNANGLSEIPTQGRFDPQIHYSAGRVQVKDAGMAGEIVDVVRPGFCSGSSVLRYAEVRVGYFVVPANEVGESFQTPSSVGNDS